MSFIALTTILLAQAAAPEAEVRSVDVTVTDDKGAAIQGLEREDVAILENGVARDIVSLQLDRRPLTVALLLDTSEALRNSYRSQVVDAAGAFLRGLPEGSRFAVWTTGDRPQKRVDFTDDAKAAEKSLQRVVPQGGSTLLDAILEAAADLKKKEGERSAIVIVSAAGPEFSNTFRERVVDKALGKDLVYLAVLVEEGETGIENRTNYDYVLENLARKSGGAYTVTLSPMGLGRELQGLLAALSGRYRLTYATLPDLKERKVEVTVARPGARARLASSQAKK
jgi:VWFA-related protein